MEIFSIRPSQSFQFRKQQKSQSQQETFHQPPKGATPSGQFPEIDPDKPDYNAISAAEVREIARRSYETGAIDHDTYSALSEGLPLQTIDPQGHIIDLSGISETTPFDFRSFYEDQLTIAASIGDPRTRSIRESVLAFINS